MKIKKPFVSITRNTLRMANGNKKKSIPSGVTAEFQLLRVGFD